VFLTDLDPQHRLLDQIEDAIEKSVKAHGDNILWRLYRDESGDSLVVVSADDRPLSGIISWASTTIEITGGSAGVFTRDPSGAPAMKGDILWK
jgi:hypothetical protein